MLLDNPQQRPDWLALLISAAIATVMAIVSLRTLPACDADTRFPTIHVWTQPHCGACDQAKRELREAGIVAQSSGDPQQQPRGVRDKADLFPLIWWRARGKVWYVCGWRDVDDLRRRVARTQRTQ